MHHSHFNHRQYHIIGDFNTAAPVVSYRKPVHLKGSPNKSTIVDRKASCIPLPLVVDGRPKHILDCLTLVFMSDFSMSKNPSSVESAFSLHGALPSSIVNYRFSADDHVMSVKIIDSFAFDVSKKRDFLKKYFDFFRLKFPTGKTYSSILLRMDRKFFLVRKDKQYKHAKCLSDLLSGVVGKHGALYVSDWVVDEAKERNDRNIAKLKDTYLVSSRGHMTIFDAWQSSVSNPINRRNELLTRINGMEKAANEMGYACLFVTLTAPSSFHSSSRKYQGFTPRETLNVLNSQWNEFRTEYCKNKGIEMFGLSIIEPHKDGSPHLHKILFLPSYVIDGVVAEMSKIALRIDGDENGAAPLPGFNHFSAGHYKNVKGQFIECDKDTDGAMPACGGRFKAVLIDPERGSATGYVVKYVTKSLGFDVDNQDYDVQSDINFRIRAWASFWGIRQFDFFGTPPVSLWRESRRMFQECHFKVESQDSSGSFSYIRITDDSGKKRCFGNQQLTDAIDQAVYHAGHTDFKEFVDSIGGFSVSKKDLSIHTYSVEKLNKYGEKVRKLDGLEYQVTLEENFGVSTVDRHCNHVIEWKISNIPHVDLQESIKSITASSLSRDASFLVYDKTNIKSYDNRIIGWVCSGFSSNGVGQFSSDADFDDYKLAHSKRLSALIDVHQNTIDFDADVKRGALAELAMVAGESHRAATADSGSEASRTRINNSVIKEKQEIKEKVLFSCYPSITKRGTAVKYSHLYCNFRN
ncbi:replication endonuclease [Methylomonas sp. HYX-M1]|uniref:replication endonuclease n=1 Tax=Methylomonas sp. HYX-M1 TaxID=3139307 RepID=UPI00345C1046